MFGRVAVSHKSVYLSYDITFSKEKNMHAAPSLLGASHVVGQSVISGVEYTTPHLMCGDPVWA